MLVQYHIIILSSSHEHFRLFAQLSNFSEPALFESSPLFHCLLDSWWNYFNINPMKINFTSFQNDSKFPYPEEYQQSKRPVLRTFPVSGDASSKKSRQTVAFAPTSKESWDPWRFANLQRNSETLYWERVADTSWKKFALNASFWHKLSRVSAVHVLCTSLDVTSPALILVMSWLVRV